MRHAASTVWLALGAVLLALPGALPDVAGVSTCLALAFLLRGSRGLPARAGLPRLALVLYLPIARENKVVAGLITVVIAIVLGAPVFTALGGAALLLFWGAELPTASLSLDHYRLVVNPSLPAIPLFTLAGYFLAESGAPRRLCEYSLRCSG